MRLFRRTPASPPAAGPVRLHVGSGRERLAGWINIDLQDLPGVDVVADVTQGLDFTGVEAIFAEHFLEHLAIDDAFAFLAEAHRALAPGGWLRLSTPNLEWVWATHYHREASDADRRVMALRANRAFHAWGHRFLWNWPLLEAVLSASGFAPVRPCRYGESELPVFAGLERHATYEDEPGLPHVLIAEAARAGSPDTRKLRELRALVESEFLEHWRAR